MKRKLKLGPNQTAWVEALESGRYISDRGRLKWESRGTGNPSYCCLGVACEISSLGAWVLGCGGLGESTYAYLGENEYLPTMVMDWLGMKNISGSFTQMQDGYTSLAAMNDGGCSFVEIAKVIRERADELFREAR